MAIEVQKQFFFLIKAGLMFFCCYYQALSIEVSFDLLIENKEQRKYVDSAIVLRTIVVLKRASDKTFYYCFKSLVW